MNEIPPEKYKSLYERMCKANNALEQKILKLQAQLNSLLFEKEQWVKEKVKQQEIFQGSMNKFNKGMNSILEENQDLKRKLRNGN